MSAGEEIDSVLQEEEQRTDGAAVSAITVNRNIGEKIAFLFLHEQPHQIPHVAPILNALNAMIPSAHIGAFVLGRSNAELLRGLVLDRAQSPVTITSVEVPALKSLERMIGGAGPLGRIGAIRSLAKTLKGYDMIVAPETTSMMLKSRYGVTEASMVYTQHGAGDRAVGFKMISQYDQVLVPGEKIKDRMIAEGLVTDGRYAVVGYPKFDCRAVTETKRTHLFDNDLPVLLYNPHFDPHLSSWFSEGEGVLDHVLARDDINLIFAPHIMLWSRRLHVTSNLRHFKWRRSLAKRFLNHSRVHIDTGSMASIDMTYTEAADIYLGDVSSQVYEFIRRPRPCLFLNTHDADWKNDPNYAHWHLGPVLTSAADLSEALDYTDDIGVHYKIKQERAFQKTFGKEVTGSADRAARALVGVLDRRRNAQQDSGV